MNIPDLVIRPAVMDDLPAILDLYQELDATYGHYPDEGGVDYRELWRQVMADTRQQVLVGEQDGEIVGTVTLIIVPNLGHRGKPWAAVENVVVLQQSTRPGPGNCPDVRGKSHRSQSRLLQDCSDKQPGAPTGARVLPPPGLAADPRRLLAQLDRRYQ